MRDSADREKPTAGWSYAMFATVALLAACSSTDQVAQTEEGGVESRALPQMQRPTKPGKPAQPGAPSQANVQLPTFPKNFEVQGPESDSFGFAVTQPGLVTVDVQAQGAPVVVTLQSPSGPPITQQGKGALKLDYNMTPQDVQRSMFWTVQIRLAQPAPPRQGGRASGTVNVQHPPVDQAAVQKTMQALVAQQKQPSPQEIQSAGAKVAAQMEQAFQQRKTQFEQQQLQRRANLYARIKPQVDQLRGRMGAKVRTRGLEETADPAEEDPMASLPPPNVVWMTDDAQEEEQKGAGEVNTRALPDMRRPMT